MRSSVALVAAVALSACGLLDTDRGFRIEGHLPPQATCSLKVQLVGGASFEAREVRGDFYEFYGVGPREANYEAVLLCGEREVASKNFRFGASTKLDGTVNLGEIKL